MGLACSWLAQRLLAHVLVWLEFRVIRPAAVIGCGSGAKGRHGWQAAIGLAYSGTSRN